MAEVSVDRLLAGTHGSRCVIALRADDIHARVDWPVVLEQLGVAGSFLRVRKAGPCPACGGHDRYTFDNRKGRGDFICRQCGAGDGFALLERVHGWAFSEARRRVIDVAGLGASSPSPIATPAGAIPIEPEIARPTARIRDLARSSCPVADCADAINYLDSRGLWPLPPQCSLRAHAGAEYFEEARRIGRYPALLASVRDIDGASVSMHVTYLSEGNKLEDHTPRKLLGPLTGRTGCAVRLVPLEGDTLGIAEGIETALSAIRLHEVPTWAAMSAPVLAKFEPPDTVRRLIVFADRDIAGLEATARLFEHLQGRVTVEMRLPSAPATDFNEALIFGEKG